MTQGQLFAGIGGFALAAQWAGIKNIWANEIDAFCCKVLKKNFPKLQIYERDIREIGNHNLKPVDIITGGFPCQPFSHAGKRKGREDDRYLWPEMLRVIQELKPSWVIGENVAGLISMENGKTLERILIDLEDSGYHTEAFLISASAVGAWHRRNRIWIVAKSESHRDRRNPGAMGEAEKNTKEQNDGTEPNSDGKDVPSRAKEYPLNSHTINTGSHRKGMHFNRDAKLRNEQERDPKPVGQNVSNTTNTWTKRVHREQWETEPELGRLAHGIPNRVDRLKALGNAIVPQVAYEIFKAIQLIEADES